ncbi:MULTISPECIES: hypothetical protein [unclassified Microcoleus]|uniref:hypothetical protein n=1 Tax=unclassified Microcoleus TaxID=2642155 RepID=UPI002FD27480
MSNLNQLRLQERHDRGHGNAVSLPQNNIVGKRHCRLLISGNIKIHTTLPDYRELDDLLGI